MDDMDRIKEDEEFYLKHSLSMLRESSSNRPSAANCIECGTDIPKGRREAVPGVQRCVNCAA